MTAVLRSILCRNRFLLSSTKCPMKSSFQKLKNPMISFSLCTIPWKNIARSRVGGWEFSIRQCYRSDMNSWKMKEYWEPKDLPYHIHQNEIVIKHVGSNIAFRFCGYDAIIKYIQEKETKDPLGSDIPSYPSPLLPVYGYLYDSAFVGRVFIEEPGEEGRYINPIWEDIDRKTLLQQIVWTTMNERIATIPKDVLCLRRRCNDKELSFVNIDGVKVRPKNDSLHPLCNYAHCLYSSSCVDNIGHSCLYMQMVITDFGWFVHLDQLYHFWSHRLRGEYRKMRKREITMHCSFEEDIIYREIVERDVKDLKNKLTKEVERRQDDEMLVCFHEAKQLRIEEINAEDGSMSPNVDVATPYSPFLYQEQPAKLYTRSNVGDLKTLPRVDLTHFAGLNVPDCTIESAFANSEDPIQYIEDNIGTPVKIIPIFGHPHNPNIVGHGRFNVPQVRPRKVYKLASNPA